MRMTFCKRLFARLMQKPPSNTDEPLRPSLVRVAVNLSRDVLRRRRRQGYIGPWLPAPLETEKVAVFLSRLVQGGVGIEEQTRVVELNGLFALITKGLMHRKASRRNVHHCLNSMTTV